MPGRAWRLVPAGEVDLEVLDRGDGEPVLVIQTGLTADELLPVADHLLRDGYRPVLPHRRGYGRSGPAGGPGSIDRDVLDCRRLLDALGIDRAHLVGLSYSGAVALELAASRPSYVATLSLLEPPPLQVPSAPAFVAVVERLLAEHRRRGPTAALELFAEGMIGPDWRTDLDGHLPGASGQAERDADAFFGADLPALLDWRFAASDARRVSAPVLHVGGSDSGPWFAEVRRLVLEWFPGAEDVVVEGADHWLALTHPVEVAGALASFLRRHPLGR